MKTILDKQIESKTVCLHMYNIYIYYETDY